MSIQDQVNAAQDLAELLEILNGYKTPLDEDGEPDHTKSLENEVNMCGLPTFGKEPNSKDLMECFSWDDNYVLIQNTCTGAPFSLQERTDEFGR